MKQAALIICLLFGSLCYGEELLNPYCYGGVYCVETSILREPKNGLPSFSEMLFDIGCYINSWSCPHSNIWKDSIEGLTIGARTTFSAKDYEIELSENFDTIYLNASEIKTVCIRHLDATRCADSLLLWELILKMEETK